jgi:hypothetical protein
VGVFSVGGNTFGDACKTGPWHELHQLGEKRLVRIHEEYPKSQYEETTHKSGVEIQIGTK